ncbi:MAG: hypothetical protein RSC76_08260 [Oscillospiraceae bacterium]
MKKIIIGLLCGVMALSMAACGSETNSSVTAPEEKPVVTRQQYGKVASIIGNELEFTLAKNPFPEEESSIAPEGGGDGTMAAAVTTEAIKQGDEAQAAPKLALEYTGESKSYVIPAGVKINGLKGGEEQLTAIGKGSVLAITMNQETGELLAIQILE